MEGQNGRQNTLQSSELKATGRVCSGRAATGLLAVNACVGCEERQGDKAGRSAGRGPCAPGCTVTWATPGGEATETDARRTGTSTARAAGGQPTELHAPGDRVAGGGGEGPTQDADVAAEAGAGPGDKVTLSKMHAHVQVRTSTKRVPWGRPGGARLDQRPTLDFGSGHDLTVLEFEPHVGLRADSVEPAWDSLSPSPSAPPLLACSISLFLSLSQNK